MSSQPIDFSRYSQIDFSKVSASPDLIDPQTVNPPASAMSRFTKGLIQGGINLAKGVQDMATPHSPVESILGPAAPVIRSLAQSTYEKGKSAVNAFKQGNNVKGVLGAAATLDPLAPDVTKLYEKSAGGDTAGAAGEGAVYGTALAAPGLLAKGKALGVARDVTPPQAEALTSLMDSQAGKIDPHAEITQPALPELRNAAAKMGVKPEQFQGRAGNKLALDIADKATQAHEAEVAQISKPYMNDVVSQKPIADAIRNSITDELKKNEPKLAAKLADQAAKFNRNAPLSQINATRIRFNKELSTFYNKGTSAQISSDAEVQATKAAADAARTVQYQAIEQKSGLPADYLRNLMRREGAVIEARNQIERAVNKVSPQQGEAVSTTLREKIAGTRPSRTGVEHSAIREVFGLKPVETLNSRFQAAFGDLGSHEVTPSYVQQPNGTLLRMAPPAVPLPRQGSPAQAVGGIVGGYRNAEDVMNAAKRGDITPEQARRLEQRFGRNATITRPIAP